MDNCLRQYTINNRLEKKIKLFYRQITSSNPIVITENSTLLKSQKMKLNLLKFKAAFQNRNAVVDLLAVFFGVGSWIGVNSVYLQLPLLVANSPEGWNLPSFLVVIIQLGNIGPLIYTLLQKFIPNKVKDTQMIYLVLVIAAIAAILMAVLYRETAYILGEKRSIAIFILVFFLALVGCTSSVLFMPYMGRFRAIYMITYLIGEGLSGFLPSIVTLIQGIGGNAQCILSNTTNGPEIIKYNPPANFDTGEFFIFVFVILLFSTLAFILLDNLDISKREHAAVTIQLGLDYKYDEGIKEPEIKHEKITSFNYVYLMILMAVVCMFGNGVFPSIQSYSCLPYGNLAYHLTVTLSSIANPLACFLAVFIPHTSIKWITSLSVVAGIVSCYALTTSFMSPNPPLVGTVGGQALVVICWIVLVGLISYIKLCIITVFRFQGGKSLVVTGGLQQVGSFIGAIITFGLINYTNLFISYEPC